MKHSFVELLVGILRVNFTCGITHKIQAISMSKCFKDWLLTFTFLTPSRTISENGDYLISTNLCRNLENKTHSTATLTINSKER